MRPDASSNCSRRGRRWLGLTPWLPPWGSLPPRSSGCGRMGRGLLMFRFFRSTLREHEQPSAKFFLAHTIGDDLVPKRPFDTFAQPRKTFGVLADFKLQPRPYRLQQIE